jgi:cell division protein FtsQ
MLHTKQLTKINILGIFNYTTKEEIQHILEEVFKKHEHVAILKLHNTLTNKLLFIDSIDITFQKDELSIYMEEMYPIAIINDKKLLTNTGVVVDYEFVIPQSNLPTLYCDETKIQQIIFLYLTMNHIFKGLSFKIKSLKVDSFSGCNFIIEDVEVKISYKNMIEDIQKFIMLYNTKLIGVWSNVKKVDMRHLNGGSVLWNNNFNLR